MSAIKNPNNRYINRKGTLFFIFITLILTPFILLLTIPNHFNSNGNDFIENNLNSFESLKLSGNEINITTPENKTYYKPLLCSTNSFFKRENRLHKTHNYNSKRS